MKKRVLRILLLCLFAGVLLKKAETDARTGSEDMAEDIGPVGGSGIREGDPAGEGHAEDGGAGESTWEGGPVGEGHAEDAAVRGTGDELLDRLEQSMYFYSGREMMGVSRLEGTEEDLLDLIYHNIETWENVGGCVYGQVDLSFEGLVLASLECGSARQIFIALPEGIYRISSAYFADRGKWKERVQKGLEEVFGEQKLGKDRTEDFFSRNSGYDGYLSLWYKGLTFLFDQCRDQYLLSWEKGEDGISFQGTYRGSGWKEGDVLSERTYEFRRLDGLGRTGSGRELREQLQGLCAGMRSCHIWEGSDGVFFAEAEYSDPEHPEAEAPAAGRCGDLIYATSTAWQEEAYVICCTNRDGEADGSGIEQLLWANAGEASYYWTCNENAILLESDERQGCYVYRKDIGMGRPYIFSISLEEDKKEEGSSSRVYRLSVYREGQSFYETELGREAADGLYFDDLNGDGYEDLLLGDRAVERCFLWSASGGTFVEITEALGGSFRGYQADAEKRQLRIWTEKYVNDEWENLGAVYQWSGEMDCELLKELQSSYIYDSRTGEKWQENRIILRKDGEGKVLTDYIYPYEEYFDRKAEIDELWDLDFVWEQEVTVSGEKNPCILRYAQEETKEQDGTVLYTDKAFLFRWDSYLIGSYSGVVSLSPWKDIFMDEAGRMRVTYKDGSRVMYSREMYDSFYK